MDNKTAIIIFLSATIIPNTAYTKPILAIPIAVPAGFEELFTSKRHGLFDTYYNGNSVNTISVEYDHQSVLLLSPQSLVEQITAEDMPELTISAAELLAKLTQSLQRVSKQSFTTTEIVIYIDEQESTLTLIFPASLYTSQQMKKSARQQAYIHPRKMPGLIHSHSLDYLTDSYNTSYNISANDVLNLTGPSYLKTIWSYSRHQHFKLDELSFYIEERNRRLKIGRQRFLDNLNQSTPSAVYSFLTNLTFEGISFGYIPNNYLYRNNSLATPITVYLPHAGAVEIYRDNRLMDLQHFPAGLHQLKTDNWAMGSYNVLLKSKLESGAQSEQIQSFTKRNSQLRPGAKEYLLQAGYYNYYRRKIFSQIDDATCQVDCYEQRNARENVNNNKFVGAHLSYTSNTLVSSGVGVLLNNNSVVATSALDILLNSWIADRVYADGILSNDHSYGYQLGASKNIHRFGFSISYRTYRYLGNKTGYRSFNLVPTHHFNYLNLGINTFLPAGISLSINYNYNLAYQNYTGTEYTSTSNTTISLSKEFNLSNSISLRTVLNYQQGNSFTNFLEIANTPNEKYLSVQLTLGFREQSYNHQQSLYLNSRLTNTHNNTYGADYAVSLNNPSFDPGSNYTLNTNINRYTQTDYATSAIIAVDNRFGATNLGMSRTFSDNHYNQFYISQHGGFAIGEGNFAYGNITNSSALIIDASELPSDQYFEVHNHNYESLLIKGGSKSTLTVQPYNKVLPKAEQNYTENINTFYQLKISAKPGWIMPGQAYYVKLSAEKNQTVTGRVYWQGKPMTNARIVGANTVTDEEGLFIGDFKLSQGQELKQLHIKYNGNDYLCPLLKKNIKLTYGVMQLREVNCEIQ